MRYWYLTILAALTVLSCENPFSPRGPYTPRLVVYSVLSNTRTGQFVRVSSTINDGTATAADSGVSGATVTMTAGASTFVFRDTVLTREGGGPVHAYACDSLPVNHGAQYQLEVQTGSMGPVRSRLTVPAAPVIAVPAVTANSLDHLTGAALRWSAGLSGVTRSYLIRIYIEFETYQGVDTLRYRWQVPQYVSDTSFVEAIYPEFSYNDRSSFDFTYPYSSYINTLARIVYRYSITVKFRNIVFEIYQIGEPLQTYSGVVNGFKDELSLRADEPDYSNIAGGLGLFGVYTRDEILRPFPKDFFYNPAPSH